MLIKPPRNPTETASRLLDAVNNLVQLDHLIPDDPNACMCASAPGVHHLINLVAGDLMLALATLIDLAEEHLP